MSDKTTPGKSSSGHPSAYPGVLSLLTRKDRIAILEWNDKNGCYSDEDCQLEFGRLIPDSALEEIAADFLDAWLDGEICNGLDDLDRLRIVLDIVQKERRREGFADRSTSDLVEDVEDLRIAVQSGRLHLQTALYHHETELESREDY